MFRRVFIDGYLTCDRVNLDNLGPVVALVGPNGAGKSNILDAIQLAARAATTPNLDIRPLFAWLQKSRVEFQLRFVVDDFDYEYRIELDRSDPLKGIHVDESLRQMTPDGPVTLLERSDGLMEAARTKMAIGMGGTALSFVLGILPESDPIVAHSQRAVGFLGKVRYYPLDDPDEPGAEMIVTEDDYNVWAVQYRSTGNPGSSILMRLLFLWRERQADFAVIQSHLGEFGLDLCDVVAGDSEIPEIASTVGPNQIAARRWLYLYFVPTQFESKGVRVAYRQLSQGTRRIVRLITSLVFDRSSVMLIEHPEDGIHRGLLKKLIGLLQAEADPTQLILASHSAEVLNRLEPEQIRLVAMRKGSTVARALSASELQQAHDHICDDVALTDLISLAEQE